MTISKLLIFFLTISVCICNSAIAGWVGPATVLSARWGTAPGQIGIEYGDSGDDFPHSFGISKSGKIVIADPINEVLHIFDSNGSFLRDIKNPQVWAGWPYSVIVNDECAVVGYVQMTHTFKIQTGELVGKALNMGGAKYVNDDCSKIYSDGKIKGWIIYTPTGLLLSTSPEMPAELKQIKSEKMRSNKCGESTSSIAFPPDVGISDKVVTPTGDVYVWERTSDAFKILKWICREGQ